MDANGAEPSPGLGAVVPGADTTAGGSRRLSAMGKGLLGAGLKGAMATSAPAAAAREDGDGWDLVSMRNRLDKDKLQEHRQQRQHRQQEQEQQHQQQQQ